MDDTEYDIDQYATPEELVELRRARAKIKPALEEFWAAQREAKKRYNRRAIYWEKRIDGLSRRLEARHASALREQSERAQMAVASRRDETWARVLSGELS